MKNKFIYVVAFLVTIITLTQSDFNTTIVVKSKSFNASNNDVTLRDLALLASLVYEDTPNNSNYSSETKDDLTECKSSTLVDGKKIFSAGCNYKYFQGKFYKRDGYDVEKYVEGLSKRKLNWFTAITTTTIENGQLYYFLDYAQTNEAYDWEVVASQSNSNTALQNKGVFDAITFKNGDNYIISYRGTDFPDVYEWIQDLAYAVGGHVQSKDAWDYAQSEYVRIKEVSPKAKIYITGHSLGAYLAQVGGAAIIDYERENNITKSSLEKVAYFNGMGMSALGIDNIETKNVMQNLQYLSTHDTNGKIVNDSNHTINYNSDKSSGRLVLYSMYGDPVSNFGIHLGEIVKLNVGLDSVYYHDGNHKILINGSFSEALGKNFEGIRSIPEYIRVFIFDKIKNGTLITDAITDTQDAIYQFNNSLSQQLSSLVYNLNIIQPDEEDTSIYNFGDDDVYMPDEFKGTGVRRALYGIKEIFTSVTKTLSTKYNIKADIIEAFNMGHETDSFLCLIDENGGIPKIVNVNTEEGNNVYIKSNEDNIKNPTIIYTNGVNSSITPEVIDGCATGYNWYETDENYNKLSKIPINESNVPTLSLNDAAAKNEDVKHYILEVTYGNTATWAKLNQSGNKIEYVDSESEELYNDGINKVVAKYEVIYDKKGPTCNVPAQINEELKCFIFCKNKDINLNITCNDNLSGFYDTKVSKKDFKLSNVGLVPSVTLENIDSKNDENNNFNIKMGLKIRRVPSWKTPVLYYDGSAGITDRVGNPVKFGNIEFNIKESK